MNQPADIKFYSLQGISCAGCVRSVDKALLILQQQQPELLDYSINFADRSAVISGSITSQLVINSIQQAGYDASLLVDEADRDQLDKSAQTYFRMTLTKSLLAMAVGLLLMVGQMAALLDPLSTLLGLYQGAAQAVLSAAVMYFCAQHIYRGAWQSIKNAVFNMDILIALGTLSAWLYSLSLIVLMSIDHTLVPAVAQHLYFEASVMILGFILLGQALEAKVRGNTAKAVQSLVKLQPQQAWRKNSQGDYVQVPVQLIVPGDELLVKPGETIAVDGDVIQGESEVDESMISGESMPVFKKAGEQLIGSTLNTTGALVFKVSQVGSNTVLAQIIAQVRKAQNAKPALGRLADKIAALFVPAVLVIAGITALSWWWFGPVGNWSYVLSTTMAVLIIACPCALGLATPMSTMIGVGLGAQKGILIQNGDALQVAKNLTTVALDKTGTITRGKPEVTDCYWLSESEKSKIWQYLTSIEQRSEHPLAKAVVAFCNESGQRSVTLDIQHFVSNTGLGVSASVDDVSVRIGSLSWLQVTLSPPVNLWATQSMARANTLVGVEVSGELVAILAIADALKPDSIAAISQLQRAGLKVVILSGDTLETVAAIAKQVNVTEFKASLSPQQKQQQITDMQKLGEVVAMVGDGINDAPALAVADLGCAIGTGTDVAINSADITLVNGSLSRLNDAIKVSTLTLRNIKQNLFGAFAYNIIAIPIAAGVLYPTFGLLLNPMLAGAAMALSSITVVGNAYRLKAKINNI